MAATLESSTEKISGKTEEKVDLQKILARLIDYWYWFLVGILVCVALAIVYCKYTSPSYKIEASILVDDGKEGNKSSAFGSSAQGNIPGLGSLLSTSSSVDNEMQVILSKDLASKVVRDLHLNITYINKTNWTPRELFDKTPIKLVYQDDSLIDNNGAVYEFEFKNATTFQVKEVYNKKTSSLGMMHVGQTFMTRFGRVSIVENPNYVRSEKNIVNKLFINVESVKVATAKLNKAVVASLPDEKASAIDLEYSSTLPEKGQLVLATYIKEYIAGNLNQKNLFADSTINFINQRLSIVSSELSGAENQLARFKESNHIADLEAQGQAAITSLSTNTQALNEANVKLSVVNTMLHYIQNSGDQLRTIPSLITSPDPTYLALLNNYNALVQKKSALSVGLTDANPEMISLSQQLGKAKQDLVSNLKSTSKALQIASQNLSQQTSNGNSYIAKAPSISKDFLSLSRQQDVKQSLYLYMLQRREEFTITKASNIPSARVIDTPSAGLSPVSPKSSLIYAFAFLLGLIIPYVLILIKEIMDNKVSSVADVTNKNLAPLLAEISHVANVKPIDFKADTRSIQAEQFRTLRTNVQFILGNKSGQKHSILFTSSMSGEGKSFIALNLARVFATLGKKVIMLDLDLRKPRLAENLSLGTNTKGMSNFLSNSDLHYTDVATHTDIPTLDVITSGPIPPNPSELLQEDRLDKLVEELKADYDIVILDTAPVGLVSDAQLLDKYADATIYVIRQNYTFKTQLNIITDQKAQGKLHNLNLVINDVAYKRSYGYGYGGYGYGYGYGYGSNEQTKNAKVNIWERIKKMLKK